jgi:hypothetical protein
MPAIGQRHRKSDETEDKVAEHERKDDEIHVDRGGSPSEKHRRRTAHQVDPVNFLR